MVVAQGPLVPPASEGARTGRLLLEHPGTQRVANRPIVCHVIDTLRAAGVMELAVIADTVTLPQIQSAIASDRAVNGDPVVYLAQAGGHGLIGALQTSASFVGEAPCVIHSADGLVGQPLMPFVELFEEERVDMMLLLHRAANPPEPLGPRMRKLIGVSELDSARTRLGLAGVCFAGPGVLQRPCARLTEAETEVELPLLVDRVAAEGKSVQTAFVDSWHRYGGSPADLLELNRIILDQQSADGDRFEGTDNRIEGRVVIHPTAEVTSSVILGPSIIGPLARIADAYIGPYTSIGAGAEIEGAEIERSIVLSDAKILHVGGRIEASTVGRRASIFRDFGLPRAMRLHVGDDVEVGLN